MIQGTAVRTGNSLLVVEDDEDLRDGIVELLKSEGFEVATATNGREALERLRASPSPDLILLDLMMPVMDGWEFRLEQKRDPVLRRIPVVAITADDSAKAAVIDADGFLHKPFAEKDLLQALRGVIAAAQAERLAQMERLAALGRLAAGVAHEINNPLSYVLSNIQIIQDHLVPMLRKTGAEELKSATGGILDPQDFEAMVEEALLGSQRIQAIVRDIQIFSSAQNEEPQTIDVRPVLDSSIKVAMSRIRHRGRLFKEYRDVPRVLANAGRLGQVFLNLLLNAADALPEGEAQHNSIRVVTMTEKGRCIVEVADTGTGIPPAILSRIFDPFFTTKPVGTGTGLGLFVCQGIVQSLGGEITVNSEMGKGTIFRISLPASYAIVQPIESSFPAELPSRARILVVDDNEGVASGIARALGLEHDVKVVNSGKEAVDLLRGGSEFDVVLCDLHMPVMSGMDVWSEVRKTCPGKEDRLVFMTGGMFTDQAVEFTQSVHNAIIEKPINFPRLNSLLLDMQKKSERMRAKA